jgi:glucokinase
VVDGVANLTNLKWILDEKKMAQDLGVKRVALINDFGGNALGVTALTPENCVVFQDVPAKAGAPIGLIGAGTGLGQAYMTWGDGVYNPFSSEGGHSDFAPQNDLQMGLVHFLNMRIKKGAWTAKEYKAYRGKVNAYSQEEIDVPSSPSKRDNVRISNERVVSGTGWPHIYDYLRTVYPDRIDPVVDGKIQNAPVPAQVISSYARSDYLCNQTVKLFIDMYGAEAGNLCMKLFCFGGLFIAGGVAQYCTDLMKEDERFIKSFKNKGRLAPALNHIPIYLIKDEAGVGLLGAGILARRVLYKMGIVNSLPVPPANAIVKTPTLIKSKL